MHDSASTAVFNVDASPEGVRDGLQRIRRFLDDSGVHQDMCGTAEIVLAEALNNVAEHAYELRGIGDVIVTLLVEPDGIQIDIVDFGLALPGLDLPRGKRPSLHHPKGALPEGGFGWFLIRSQTDALRYHRDDGRNHLYMHLTNEAG
ncbi:ATP-binding protein [Rhodobacteraceae bacterium KMM 6894]|nr:ATP-binding protein [Rhodobacteraceae bacterium KMM 6894]